MPVLKSATASCHIAARCAQCETQHEREPYVSDVVWAPVCIAEKIARIWSRDGSVIRTVLATSVDLPHLPVAPPRARAGDVRCRRRRRTTNSDGASSRASSIHRRHKCEPSPARRPRDRPRHQPRAGDASGTKNGRQGSTYRTGAQSKGERYSYPIHETSKASSPKDQRKQQTLNNGATAPIYGNARAVKVLLEWAEGHEASAPTLLPEANLAQRTWRSTFMQASMLMSTQAGTDAYSIVDNTPMENGVEAWRRLVQTHPRRTRISTS